MKAIIFASHVPTPDKLWIGLEFLNKFVLSFKDYHIYIGVSNSCEEWLDVLKEYSGKINIKFSEVPNTLDSGYGVVGAYQTALKLLHDSTNRYDIYWFGHTKGVTSNSHDFRKEVFMNFWDLEPLITHKILNEDYVIFSPYITLTGPNWLNTTLPVFIHGNDNNDLCSLYSFWVHKGEVINYFLDNCNKDFFTKDLLKIKRLNSDGYMDRYFFERDFPMIYQKMHFGNKLLYITFDGGYKAYLNNYNIHRLDI